MTPQRRALWMYVSAALFFLAGAVGFLFEYSAGASLVRHLGGIVVPFALGIAMLVVARRTGRKG